jgi:glycosyltransferase involved in cell wall biosynthesis
VIADGGSTDGTAAIIRGLSSDHPELRIQVIDNPRQVIPAALNAAIDQATGEIIIRLDAHSAPAADYVERCLAVLETTQAANVGGAWEICPSDDHWIARGIAAAAAHPIGAGDARYRVRGQAGPVETVPFGAFRRSWLERVGKFSEDLHSNEDYEYNWRIRRLGGIIWFDPTIRSVYYARRTLSELARQYARYGFWKARMLIRHPNSLRWRQAVPPLFVLSSLGLLAAAPFADLAGIALGVEWGAYMLLLLLAGLGSAVRGRDPALFFSFPLAAGTMHLSWGAAFWIGLATGLTGVRIGSNRS